MSMSCDFYESKISGNDNWVSISINADLAAPYLNNLYDTALTITKDLMDSKMMDEANPHFDFTMAVLHTIHRLEASQKGGEE